MHLYPNVVSGTSAGARCWAATRLLCRHDF